MGRGDPAQARRGPDTKKRHDKIVRKLHVAAERCRDAESHRFRWERQARGYVAAARLVSARAPR